MADRTRRAATPEVAPPAPAPVQSESAENSFTSWMLSSGSAGAMGREGAVQAQHSAAYDLGFGADRTSFDGDVYRNVNSRFVGTGMDAGPGAAGGGRYNAPGNALLYTSPDYGMSVGETSAYNGMANRTMIESRFTTAVDPSTGMGGVADVTSRAAAAGMTDALTPHVGNSRPSLAMRLMGEHPYSLTHQVGRGAADSGAAAMRVPSATGGEQINIIPRNAGSSVVNPHTTTAYDGAGVAGRPTPATGIGPINGPQATTRPGTGGALPGEVVRTGYQNTNGTWNDTPMRRGGSARYGAAGGAVGSLVDTGVRMARGEDVSLGEAALNTAVGTGVGAASGLADDALLARGFSSARAGGIVGGVIEGGMSAYNNVGAYQRGEIDGAQAIANTAVDTGVGVGAGMAGAAAGAAIGSIIPGAGTLVGAGLGFLGGMAASYLTHAAVEHSGAGDWAKRQGGRALRWVGGLFG